MIILHTFNHQELSKDVREKPAQERTEFTRASGKQLGRCNYLQMESSSSTLLLLQLAVVFGVEQLLRHLRQVLETREVNWKHVLCFLSTLLVCNPGAQLRLRGESAAFTVVEEPGMHVDEGK